MKIKGIFGSWKQVEYRIMEDKKVMYIKYVLIEKPSKPQKPNPKIDFIKQCYAKGDKQALIAKKLNCSRNYIYKVLKKEREKNLLTNTNSVIK